MNDAFLSFLTLFLKTTTLKGFKKVLKVTHSLSRGITINILLSIFVLFLLISKHPEIKRWSLAFLKEFINMKDVYGKWKLVFPLNEVDFYVLELYFHALNSLCSPYRRLPWERIEVLSSLLFISSALISLKVFIKCRNPDLTII